MNVLRALIFDCDGVLADTERDGHLPAFNATFVRYGTPIHWTESAYAEKLRIGGGKERLAAELTPDALRGLGISGESARRAFIAELHAAKTRAFAEIVARGALPARPGVVRIARELHERGVQLAIASTSAEGSVRAVLESVAGEEFAREFRVFAGDIVPHKKPAPDIYRLALERLGVGAEAALVIEDSRNGLLSASRAGLATLVTVTGFTRNEPMEEAALVLSSLGDPGGPPVEVIANRTAAEIGPYATSETLEACLAFRAAQSSI